MLHHYIIIAVVQCANISYYSATFNTTETMYSTVVKVTCNSGLKFTGSGFVEGDNIVSVCSLSGQWLPEVPFCEGITEVLLLLMI